jgi:hypothetical protein
VCGLALWPAGGSAQDDRHLSVSYLRAALGSLEDRTSVSVLGEYVGESGMVEATGYYLRNKGYSRFTIQDPATGVAFGSIYCSHDSSVFNELLTVRGKKRYVFHGYKGTAEGRKDGFFVTSLTAVAVPAAESPEVAAGPRTFRVTVIDQATSNRTVMVNVELGKPLNLMGSTLIIEAEPYEPDRIRVLK